MRTSQEVHLTVRWEKKHQTYLAAATDLRGVMGTGRTPEEALASIQAPIRQQLASPTEETHHPSSWHAVHAHEEVSTAFGSRTRCESVLEARGPSNG